MLWGAEDHRQQRRRHGEEEVVVRVLWTRMHWLKHIGIYTFRTGMHGPKKWMFVHRTSSSN